jgi:hypothetical protein
MNLNKIVYTLFIFISCSFKTIAQTNSLSNFLFIEYLTYSEKNREALFLLDASNELTNLDTIHFLKGMNYYLLKKTDSAALSFHKVSPASNFLCKSKFFESINLAYSKNYKAALSCFTDLPMDSVTKYKSIITVVTAGETLLLRNFKNFDSISLNFTTEEYRIANQQNRLLELRKESEKIKRKSPLLAGCLSAVVPGLGKFYAGKRGAALAAFATNIVLGAAVFESYYRTQSFKSPQVITFGTLFTFFYVGNIFGSVFSVKQQIKSVNGRINNEILASIHVPIVRFFK